MKRTVGATIRWFATSVPVVVTVAALLVGTAGFLIVPRLDLLRFADPPPTPTPSLSPTEAFTTPVSDPPVLLVDEVDGSWLSGSVTDDGPLDQVKVEVSSGGAVLAWADVADDGRWGCEVEFAPGQVLLVIARDVDNLTAQVEVTVPALPEPSISPSVSPSVSPEPSVTPTSTPTATPKPSKTPPVTLKPKPGGFTGVKTQVIKYKTKTVKDGSLAKGKTKVTKKGKNGIRTLTYVDGKLVSSKVTRKPVTKIVHVGTKTAPKTFTASRTLTCTSKVTLTAYGSGTNVVTRISGPSSATGGTKAKVTNGPAGTYRIAAAATSSNVSVAYGFTGCKH